MDKNKIIIALFSLILGIMIVMQSKAISNGNDFLRDPDNINIDNISKIKAENNEILQEIDDTRKKAKEYEDMASKYDSRIKEISDELYYYKSISGYEDLEGPGIILNMEELRYVGDVNSLLFNYKYILDIISYLNVTEAEAISINDVRYTWYSEIIRGDNILVIDNEIIKEPVVIKAIGDPYKLQSALEFKGGLVDVLERGYGIDIEITQEEKVIIPSTKKIKKFN